MSDTEYNLKQYLTTPREEFAISAEDLQELEKALQAFGDLCHSKNVPFVGCFPARCNNGETEMVMSCTLPIERSPKELITMQAMAKGGLVSGLEVGSAVYAFYTRNQ